MRARRRSLIRLSLAAFGFSFLLASAFAGVGWIVVKRFEWAEKVIGAGKARSVYFWYLDVAQSTLPHDSDGDGVRDGVELMMGTDPRNPGSHHRRYLNNAQNPPSLCLRGERSPLRWGMGLGRWQTVRLPRGFRMMVWTDSPVLLAKDATGAPTSGPLYVTANRQGELEFDILVGDDFVPRSAQAEDKVLLSFHGPDGGIPFGDSVVTIAGWRLPAREAFFTDNRGFRLVEPPDPRTRLRGNHVFVACPEEWAAGCLVEARRRIPDAPWERKAWLEAESQGRLPACMDIGGTVWGPQDRLEEFEFRLVPVRNSPPR